jgi:hypothetical protein
VIQVTIKRNRGRGGSGAVHPQQVMLQGCPSIPIELSHHPLALSHPLLAPLTAPRVVFARGLSFGDSGEQGVIPDPYCVSIFKDCCSLATTALYYAAADLSRPPKVSELQQQRAGITQGRKRDVGILRAGRRPKRGGSRQKTRSQRLKSAGLTSI